jgi:hypothetical protein
MAKYSLNQFRIECVARALYDAAPPIEDYAAAPLEDDPERQDGNGQAEPKKWDELDEDAPAKEEFRALATIAVEAMNEGLDEGLRQFQLPAVMAELTSLSKADALGVLYAAIERITETK